MAKRNQQKWWLLGLLPALGGIGWGIASLFRRLRNNAPVPRDSAIVPLSETPQVAVTGGVGQAPEHGREGSRGLESPDKIASDEVSDLGTIREREAAKPQKGSVYPYEEEDYPRARPTPAGYALRTNTAEGASLLLLLVPFIALAIAIIVLAAYRTPVQSSVVVPGGNVDRGRTALQGYGCGSCHTIAGVDGADGKVGPDLSQVGLHSFVAGKLQNTPDNMINWIMHPQQIVPGNGMPNMNVPANVARDMAAYLYSLNSGQHSSFNTHRVNYPNQP